MLPDQKLWTDRWVPHHSWVPALGLAALASQRASVERDQARQALTREQQRLERIVDAAHAYADDNDLCGRFDTFMLSQGLRAREREYVVDIDATVRVSVIVSA